jgi:hypothetical protein
MKVHRVAKRAASAGGSGHGQVPDPGSRNMVSSVVSSVMSPLPEC